jgi:hypothetical protein
MKSGNYSLRSKINIITMLFLLINVGGVVYVLKNITLSFIYQQLSSLFFVLILWSILIFFVYRILILHVYRPIRKIEKVLKLASVGDLSEKANYKSNDELGQIAGSIDSIIQNQSNLAEFLEKIGDGNFNIEYNVLSEKDKLGYSITGMRDKLHNLVSEDASRQWSTEGIARFGAILRENTDDVRVVCDKLLSDLVKYLNANQGALFLIDYEDNKRNLIELVSAYAWSRKKYITKKIEMGEGLVGQAAIEKGTIFLTDVPDNFITNNIRTGRRKS